MAKRFPLCLTDREEFVHWSEMMNRFTTVEDTVPWGRRIP